METFRTSNDHVIISLESGELLLESIQDACETFDIDTGAVVSAIGTLRNLRVHYLHTDDLAKSQSERNTMVDLDGCWEVSGIQGLIADGEPHLHVTAWDGERTIAGHLEEGNEVNALAEIAIRSFEGVHLERRPNASGVSMLRQR